MKKHQLQECPVCSSALMVSEYHCPGCETVIRGRFLPLSGRLGRLSREDQEFIEHFVRSRGSIKEMEKILGVSYPTVRGMLNRVIESMGYQDDAYREVHVDRQEILRKLEQGEIRADEAAAQLRGETQR